LQYIHKDFSFVPVIVSDPEKAAVAVKKTIEKTGKSVMFIVSSDFTHYGENYGFS